VNSVSRQSRSEVEPFEAYNFDGPEHMMASFRRATNRFNETQLERFGAMADEGPHQTAPLTTSSTSRFDPAPNGLTDNGVAEKVRPRADSLSQNKLHR
jgi:hypothetical protein